MAFLTAVAASSEDQDGGWLDPAPVTAHDCADHLPYARRPLAEPKDVGRRFRCSCGQVWRIEMQEGDDFSYALWFRSTPANGDEVPR